MATRSLRLNYADATGPGRVGEILFWPLDPANNSAFWQADSPARIPLKYNDPLHAPSDPAYDPEYTVLGEGKYVSVPVTVGASYGVDVIRINNTRDNDASFSITIPAGAGTLDISTLTPTGIPVPTAQQIVDAGVATAVGSGTLTGAALAANQLTGLTDAGARRDAVDARVVAIAPALDGVDRTYTPAAGKTNGWEAIWNSALGYLIHARAGTDTTADGAVIGIGTDKGAGNGILISHKNDGSGLRLIHNPSGGIGFYATAYSTNPMMFVDQYSGAGAALVAKYRTGAGFKDGALIQGSTALASATAAFAAGDVGQAVSQIATRALNDPGGSIPDSTTIAAVVDTTVAAGSNGAALPQAVISLASVAGVPVGGGVIAVTSGAGVQLVTFTGVSGSTITGCSGGTGVLATGNAARLAVMSQPAAHTATAMNFRVSGRAVNESAGIIEGRNADDSVWARLSKTNGLQFNPSDATAPSFRVKGKNGQTNNIFEVINFASGAVVLSGSENGISGAMGASLNNASNNTRRPLFLTNFTAGIEVARLKHGVATPTADMLVMVDNGDAVLSRFNKAGYFITKKNAAPADADLTNGETSIWHDPTNAAAKFMLKGKETGGTVRTIGLPMSPVALAAAATDAATTQTLVNDIRAKLVATGMYS